MGEPASLVEGLIHHRSPVKNDQKCVPAPPLGLEVGRDGLVGADRFEVRCERLVPQKQMPALGQENIALVSPNAAI
jgi:hypothetical protein